MPLIRQAHEKEFLKVYDLIRKINTLENYPEHFFKIMIRYFRNTFFVAEENGGLIGVCWGFLSQKNEDTCFLWQIGVIKAFQGKGIGRSMLGSFERALRSRNIKKIELTIAPDNQASQRLFKTSGYENISHTEENAIRVENINLVKNYYRPGGDYMLFRKEL